VILSGAMVVAALILLWTYTAGNAWWRSRVGRALVTLAAAIVFIEVYSALRRLLDWPSWTSQVEQGIILVALILLDVAFLRERREQRRRQSARRDGAS
jgi:chromate transport protein ChrA